MLNGPVMSWALKETATLQREESPAGYLAYVLRNTGSVAFVADSCQDGGIGPHRFRLGNYFVKGCVINIMGKKAELHKSQGNMRKGQLAENRVELGKYRNALFYPLGVWPYCVIGS